MGVNAPQAELGVQAQFTPAFDESFDTFAATIKLPPTLTELGSAGLKETAMPGMMVTFPEAMSAKFAAEAAMMVTDPPAGTVGGAV